MTNEKLKVYHLSWCSRDGYFLLKLLHAKLLDMEMSYLVFNLFERFVEKKTLQSKKMIKHNDHTALWISKNNREFIFLLK